MARLSLLYIILFSHSLLFSCFLLPFYFIFDYIRLCDHVRRVCVYVYSFRPKVNAPLAAREAKAAVDEIRNHSMTDADAFKRSNEGMRALVRFNNRFWSC